MRAAGLAGEAGVRCAAPVGEAGMLDAGLVRVARKECLWVAVLVDEVEAGLPAAVRVGEVGMRSAGRLGEAGSRNAVWVCEAVLRGAGMADEAGEECLRAAGLVGEAGVCAAAVRVGEAGLRTV